MNEHIKEIISLTKDFKVKNVIEGVRSRVILSRANNTIRVVVPENLLQEESNYTMYISQDVADTKYVIEKTLVFLDNLTPRIGTINCDVREDGQNDEIEHKTSLGLENYKGIKEELIELLKPLKNMHGLDPKYNENHSAAGNALKAFPLEAYECIDAQAMEDAIKCKLIRFERKTSNLEESLRAPINKTGRRFKKGKISKIRVPLFIKQERLPELCYKDTLLDLIEELAAIQRHSDLSERIDKIISDILEIRNEMKKHPKSEGKYLKEMKNMILGDLRPAVSAAKTEPNEIKSIKTTEIDEILREKIGKFMDDEISINSLSDSLKLNPLTEEEFKEKVLDSKNKFLQQGIFGLKLESKNDGLANVVVS